MASSKDRERKLARAKIDRQMARRAEKVRIQRQRQSQIGIGLAILLVLAGVGWVTNWYGITSKAKPQSTTIAKTCAWTPVDTTTSADLKNTGVPPVDAGLPAAGSATMTIKLNAGTVTAKLDATKSKCAVASFSFLAETKFFDGTTCSDLDVAGPYILECGDPSGKGDGGPSYTIPDENLPTDFAPAPAPSASSSATPSVIYPAGTLAMASAVDSSTGQVTPDSGGSRFLLFYKDSALPPNFSVFGQITSGLDVITKIAKAGVASSGGKAQTAGAPKHSVIITTLTVSPVTNAAEGAPSGSPSAPASSKS